MTPRGRKDDDLFKESSMSFGEHLMELRRCLIMAILWLAGGFILAMIPLGSHPSLATMTVSYIQRPLRLSLEKYYQNQSSNRLMKQREKLRKQGYREDVLEIPSKKNMSAREFWVFPGDIKKIQSLSNVTVVPPVDTATGEPPKTEPPKANDSAAAEAVATGTDAAVSADEPQLILLWEKLADDSRTRTKALNMPETFVIWLKAACLVGFLLASPGIFHSFWMFVGAGLYPNEKRMVRRFLPLSILLFISGFSLAFFVAFELVLKFLLGFNSGMNIDPDPRISEWLNLAIMFPIAFGLGFQLPLVMFALVRLRIFKAEDYIKHWKMAVLVIAFCAMMLTPPDPWSMICLMTPLLFLYYLGVFLSKTFPPPPSSFEELESAEKAAEDNDKSTEEKSSEASSSAETTPDETKIP